MILFNKTKEELGKEYSLLTTKEKVFVKCDYCGLEFQKIKGNIIKGRKIILKDSCSDCVKIKREESNLKLYGVKNSGGLGASLKKAEETNKKKYGSSNPMKVKEIKEKVIQTNLKKYGVDCVFKSESIKTKIKKTNLKKYGEEIASKSVLIKEKTNVTNKKRYSEGHHSKTQDFIDKVKKTNLKKYNVENVMFSQSVIEKRKKYFNRKYGYDCPLKSPDVQKKAKKTLIEKYGSPFPKNLKFGKAQNRIKLWLNSMELEFESNSFILKNKEIDLYNSDLKIGIEYCGLFWHNEQSKSPRLKNYHYDKLNDCLSNGIFLITIFEDEWKFKQKQCKNMLRSILGKCEERVFARNCEIKEIEKTVHNNFCEENHIQGSTSQSLVRYGLIHNNELISAMSLGRHHRGKEGIVLNRFCVKDNYSVVGGFSRLFKKCKEWAKIKKYKKVISWSDNRWSKGNVYLKNGFKLDCELPSDYCYVNTKNPKKRISKQSQSKKKTNCPEGKTEYEWCLERGLSRIWDCGKKRWVFDL